VYNQILHNYKFVQAHRVELLLRVHTKFTLKFLDLHTSFSQFSNFGIHLLELFNEKENGKRFKRRMGRIRPMASALWHGSTHRGDRPTQCPAAHVTRSAPWSLCSGHARGGGVARLARVHRRTRCPVKGSASTV
jgi:hypothetical protein